MRSMQYLNSKHRIGIASALRKHGPDTPEDRPAANVHEALDRLVRIVADPCYTDPDGLTQDRITAYALALIRLRECASAAGLERLRNACDALAVTVSRLIDDRNCASHEKCAALTRFVVHAQEMLRMPADRVVHLPPPTPDMPIVSARMPVERHARASK